MRGADRIKLPPRLVLTPEHWSPRGEAVGQIDGRRIVVFGGIPGEMARVRVVRHGPHRDYAVFEEAVTDDPRRVSPSCPQYVRCGGCPRRHLTPAAQREALRAEVQATLAAEGLSQVSVEPLTPGPDSCEGARHVIKLGLARNARGRLLVGAWARHTREVVPIPGCPAAAPVLRSRITAVARAVQAIGLPAEPRSDRGPALRAVQLRASRDSGQVLTTLFASGDGLAAALQPLVETLLGWPEIAGVALHRNADPGNALFKADADGNLDCTELGGAATIVDRLADLSLEIGPVDFFQTNPAVADALYRSVIARLAPEPEVPFIDAYCGVGGLALLAALRGGGETIGIEGNAQAIERARTNAARNGLTVEFRAATVADALRALAPRLASQRPVICVDPARRGLEPEVLPALLALRPRRVGYVSCNPRALARDLAQFAVAGFTIAPLHLFDMFPHTAHVEVATVLQPPLASVAFSS